MKYKACLFPFLMGSLALLCFLAVMLLVSGSVQPLWGRALILLLPAFLLCGIGILSLRGVLNDKAVLVLTSVLTVVLLFLSVFYVFLLSVWTATTETTDTKYYSRAYRAIGHEEHAGEFFPASIPEDAEDVSFLYTPQFLQGGEVFRLSYRTGEDRIAEWVDRLESAAEWSGANEAWCRSHYGTFSGTDSIRYQLYWDGGFNHGEICYILISRSDCRIESNYERW